MSTFVRFVFFVLIVGIFVNLTIVLLADARSQRREEMNARKDYETFQNSMVRQDKSLRRADIAVEWQRINARNEILETSLLIRRYAPLEGEQSQPLPVVRVKIPGTRLSVDGIVLDFDAMFGQDSEELRVFQGHKLAYFLHVYGEGQPLPEQFCFVRTGEVPELTRIHPKNNLPTVAEMRWWQRVWDLMPDLEKPIHESSRFGLKVSLVGPASRAVKIGRTYSAFLQYPYSGPEGLTLEEDSTPGLLSELLEEGAKLKDEEAAP
jgi:hypothetical protein